MEESNGMADKRKLKWFWRGNAGRRRGVVGAADGGWWRAASGVRCTGARRPKGTIRRTPILRTSRQTRHRQASILAWVREMGEHLERSDSVAMVNQHLREKNGVSEEELLLLLFWAYVKEKDAKRRTAHS